MAEESEPEESGAVVMTTGGLGLFLDPGGRPRGFFLAVVDGPSSLVMVVFSRAAAAGAGGGRARGLSWWQEVPSSEEEEEWGREREKEAALPRSAMVEGGGCGVGVLLLQEGAKERDFEGEGRARA